jgi:hypothetical protein
VALDVIKTYAPPFQARLQDAVLLARERDHILLFALHPAALADRYYGLNRDPVVSHRRSGARPGLDR